MRGMSVVLISSTNTIVKTTRNTIMLIIMNSHLRSLYCSPVTTSISFNYNVSKTNTIISLHKFLLHSDRNQLKYLNHLYWQLFSITGWSTDTPCMKVRFWVVFFPLHFYTLRHGDLLTQIRLTNNHDPYHKCNYG